MVQKLPGHIRYVLTAEEITSITAILCLLTKQAPALVSFVNSPWKETEKEQLTDMDKHLVNIQKESKMIRELMGIKIVA